MSADQYVPAPLPRWERLLCWAVWLFHSAAAFYLAFRVSQGQLRFWMKHWISESGYLPGYKVDLSDTEWEHFRNTASHMVLDYGLHSIMFYLVVRYVESKWVKLVLFFGALLMQIHMTR
ncbi:unnamed protein product [Strongylus vulgaris]|uniref:Uncharacterized protein n=1 Tax=Strongylus vulgaris TaxID=40348 RepID=A0A3P7KQG5_STRVU|nr:unnamed protein product [Strongylus vulgaris]